MSLLCILGRQPAIGLAELESRFGADAVTVVDSGAALLDVDAAPAFDHLGGTQKAAKLLTRLNYTDWSKISRYLEKNIPEHLQYIPEGKIKLGLSVYGLRASVSDINKTALSLKKVIKKHGRSVRVVPNKENELNTAQVIHNGLTGETGMEIVLIKNGSETLLAQTGWVQDIDAYRRRDQMRPARDSRVGMLPPKLAQILISLAVPIPQSVLLDPFCGTGVVLQEALLQDLSVIGTDLDQRMVEYSQKNLEWLEETILLSQSPRRSEEWLRMASNNGFSQPHIYRADATTEQWSEPFNTIACETYLGRPLSSPPDQETLQKIIHDCNVIHKKFLQNVASQTKAGFRMCIAVPAWHTKSGFKHLPVLDHLKNLGYNRVSFVHANSRDLIYHRENQIVARELVVLTRTD